MPTLPSESDARLPAVPAPQERSADVVVIGAGLSGLTAARVLTAAGVDTLVLEARTRVGGRTYTQPAADGTPLDLGGQWIGPTQLRIAQLSADLGIETFKTYDMGKNIEMRGGQRFEYAGAVPTADARASADIFESMLALNLLASEVPVEAPWQAPRAAEWDGQTAATWLEHSIASPVARALLTLGIQAIFSAEPRDLSLLHVLFYIHSAGSLLNLLGVTGRAQESRFHGGAQQVAVRMAQLLGERVVLGAPVQTIAHDDYGVHVSSPAITVTARRAIVALPPTLAGRIRYTPALRGARDQLTQRVPMGTVIKVQCLYDRPFWRDAGLTGQVSSDEGAVRITFDNSPPSGESGVLLGFIEGDEGRRWGGAAPTTRRRAVLDCFSRYFGPQAATPREYVEQVWADEEFSRGGYAGYMPPGVWTTYGPALREPLGCLHWAGTETATIWNGYMDGAVQSGERAAAEILAALGILPDGAVQPPTEAMPKG